LFVYLFVCFWPFPVSDSAEVLHLTVTQPYWGALIANANATANLQHVLDSANTTGYDASSAYTVAYVEGRNAAGMRSRWRCGEVFSCKLYDCFVMFLVV
jgi:hypothetical protein